MNGRIALLTIGLGLSISLSLGVCTTQAERFQQQAASHLLASSGSLTDTHSASQAHAPQKSLDLNDRVPPTSAFYQFQQQLRQAVRDRDVQFVQALIPPQGVATTGVGTPRSLKDLKLEQPNAPVWTLLEQSVTSGCGPVSSQAYQVAEPEAGVWGCPTEARVIFGQVNGQWQILSMSR